MRLPYSNEHQPSDLPVLFSSTEKLQNVINDKLFTLRHATQDDFPSIRSLIDTVGINPLGLDWRRFIIAVDVDNRLVGCGQVKPHWDGSFELASIAVQPEWRKRGVASAIILQLLEINPRPLYLVCRNRLGTFYEKFGFVNVTSSDAMPMYFRWLIRTIRLFQRIALINELLLKILNRLTLLGVTHERSLIMRCDNKS